MTRRRRPLPDVGMTVYRRRAHLVVWDTLRRVTVAPWPLYWCPRLKCTMACVSRLDGEGLWLRVVDCIGHWDWYTGEIVGARILDGYPYDECTGALTEQLTEHPRSDPDTGAQYYYSDRGRLMVYLTADPMAHS